jgi:hypothetical protein
MDAVVDVAVTLLLHVVGTTLVAREYVLRFVIRDVSGTDIICLSDRKIKHSNGTTHIRLRVFNICNYPYVSVSEFSRLNF